MQEKILVIEDEAKIRKVITTYLNGAGYTVQAETDGAAGLARARSWQPDLVVLDLNLPSLDGMQIAAQLSEESDVYIIMLTARGEEMDRIAGLSLGADDYITKPFSPRELVARVQARLRRSSRERAQLLAFDQLIIDPNRHVVTVADQEIDPTLTEFKLLHELARHAGFVLSRSQLLERVWEEEPDRKGRVVDVFINQLRRKLEQATGENLIETVRGVGYRFVDGRRKT